MIEHVSCSVDLSTLADWDAGDASGNSLYLELFGETTPRVDMNFAQVLPGGTVDEATANETLLSGYQYWWTLGLTTAIRPPAHHLFPHDETNSVTTRPVQVGLYFPTQGSWRIKEIFPNVFYLKPLHEQVASWHHLSAMFGEAAPTFSAFTGAASLSRLVSVAARASAFAPLEAASLVPLLMTLFAKMHINTVPPVEGFAWSVQKVSYHHKEYGLMQGIEWTIPAKMFHELGRRLTGSLTVTFLPCYTQKGDAIAKACEFQKCPILAKAFVGDQEHTVELPGSEFLALRGTSSDTSSSSEGSICRGSRKAPACCGSVEDRPAVESRLIREPAERDSGLNGIERCG